MTSQRSSEENDLNPMRSGGKQRHKFSKKDLEILKQSFKEVPYPDFTTREQLAKQLGCYLIVIDNWFQNKRARLPQEEKLKILSKRMLYKQPPQENLDLHSTDAQASSPLGRQSYCPREKPRLSGKENAGQCDPVVEDGKMSPRYYTSKHQGETGSGPSSSCGSSFWDQPSLSELYQKRGSVGLGESLPSPPSLCHFVQSAQGTRQQQQPSDEYYSPLQGEQQSGWEYFQHLPQPLNDPQQQPCQNQFLMQQNSWDFRQQVPWGQGHQLALCSQMEPAPLHRAVSSPPLPPTEYEQAAPAEEPGKLPAVGPTSSSLPGCWETGLPGTQHSGLHFDDM